MIHIDKQNSRRSLIIAPSILRGDPFVKSNANSTISKIYYKGNRWDVFIRFVPCTQWWSKFLSQCISSALLMNKILLNEQNRYPYKMATPQEKAHGLLKLNRICRVSETLELSRDPPSRPSTRAWHKKFMVTGTGRSTVLRTTNSVTNINVHVSFCNNLHWSVSSFASVINFRNCKETLWTTCTLYTYSFVHIYI